MLIAVDTETKGLSKDFVMGCIISNERKKPIKFTKKEEMWKYIKDLANKEYKRGHKLNIVAHNTEYDFYAIADLKDKSIQFLSSFNESGGKSPFLVNLVNENKEIIATFLDTYSIYKMSLAKASKLIGKEKGITPDWLINYRTPTEKEWNNAFDYMENDTQLCLDLYTHMKERLKKEGVNIRKLFSIHQIGIGYVMNKLRKSYLPELFEEKETKEQRTLIKPKFEDFILQAYRGARVEAFKTGEWDRAYCIDVNSLYPYSISMMEIPDLRTENLVNNPLKYFSEEQLFNQIGISSVCIENVSCDIGLLPVRINATTNYYPKKNKVIIGTYTNLELRKALSNGYKLHFVYKSLLYKPMKENPFKDIYLDLYGKRKVSLNDFDNWFYKAIMNSSLGKMGQRNYEVETVIDSVEQAKLYLEKNYQIIKGLDLEYMYQRKQKKINHKRFYCPIIPTLVNAYARCYMYDFLKMINEKDLLYTDTDSIIFKDVAYLNKLKKYLSNTEIGLFKLEASGETIINGRKNYLCGKKISAGGIHKANLSIEKFKSGIVENRKQVGWKSAKNFEDIGNFVVEKRDLYEQRLQHCKVIELLYNQKLYIDYKLYSIIPFKEVLKKWESKKPVSP